MNDLKNLSKGLLVLRYPRPLSPEQVSQLTDGITPVADVLGVEPMVIGDGGDVRILESGYDILLERLCVAVERLVQQGEPPAAPEQIAPPALNVRPSGLNSRPSAATVNVVEDASKAGLSRVRTTDSGEQVLDVFVKALTDG